MVNERIRLFIEVKGERGKVTSGMLTCKRMHFPLDSEPRVEHPQLLRRDNRSTARWEFFGLDIHITYRVKSVSAHNSVKNLQIWF